MNEIRAHSMSLYWLGSMLLWFGWFFFNGVSSGGLANGGAEKSGRAMVNTAIGGSSGGVSSIEFSFFFFFYEFLIDCFDLVGCVLGVLGVASCSAIGCVVEWHFGWLCRHYCQVFFLILFCFLFFDLKCLILVVVMWFTRGLLGLSVRLPALSTYSLPNSSLGNIRVSFANLCLS